MTDLLTELQCTQPPPGNCYRLIVLGSGCVGKTAIVRRFLHDDFSSSYVPTIEDFHRKIYKIHGEMYQLDILDTSGIHPFPAMRRLSFLTGDAFLLVYSAESRESFEEVLRLREQIMESVHAATGSNDTKQQIKTAPAIPMIIAGNKCDKPAHARVVQSVEVEHILQRFKDHVAFLECSAKENANVSELFETLFMLADFPDEMIPNAGRRISLTHGGNVLNNSPVMASSAGGRQLLRPGDETTCSRTGSTARHGITLRRRLSDAYSALITNVRRPSIKSDLIRVREKREQSTHASSRTKHHKKRSRKGHDRMSDQRDLPGGVESDSEEKHGVCWTFCCMARK